MIGSIVVLILAIAIVAAALLYLRKSKSGSVQYVPFIFGGEAHPRQKKIKEQEVDNDTRTSKRS